MLDVLEKLRDAGRREAELLFREHRNHPATPLPRLSERISNAINSVTDAVLKILDDASSGVSEWLTDRLRARGGGGEMGAGERGACLRGGRVQEAEEGAKMQMTKAPLFP